MRFSQVRMFKEMVHLLIHGENSDTGITPFQAFAATVGSWVGMGNIAGVATAILFGGPGAVFWMWIIAFIGTSSAFMESSLAQAYKVRTGNGEYLVGPPDLCEKERSGGTDGAGSPYRLDNGRKPGAGRGPQRIPADVSGLKHDFNSEKTAVTQGSWIIGSMVPFWNPVRT